MNWEQELKVERSNRAVGIVTCRAALYSICSLRGAWRPWMLRSVEKLNLSLFSWNCKTTDLMCHHGVDKGRVSVSRFCGHHSNDQKFLLLQSNNIEKKKLQTYVLFWQLQWVSWHELVFHTWKTGQQMRKWIMHFGLCVSPPATKPLLKYHILILTAVHECKQGASERMHSSSACKEAKRQHFT